MILVAALFFSMVAFADADAAPTMDVAFADAAPTMDVPTGPIGLKYGGGTKPDAMRLQIKARPNPVYTCTAPYRDTIAVETWPQNFNFTTAFLEAGFSCAEWEGPFMICNATSLTKPLDITIYSERSSAANANAKDIYFYSVRLRIGCMLDNKDYDRSTCLGWIGGTKPVVSTGRQLSWYNGCQFLMSNYVNERMWKDQDNAPRVNYDWSVTLIAPEPPV